MSSKPTLRDIAEATGVSTASVSMILNGKSLDRFSSERVASVLAEAERIKVVTEARARAEAMEQAGRGIAAQRKAIADGISESLAVIGRRASVRR